MKEIERMLLSWAGNVSDSLPYQNFNYTEERKFGKNDSVFVCKWRVESQILTPLGKVGGFIAFDYFGETYAYLYFDEYCKKIVSCVIRQKPNTLTLQSRINAFCTRYASAISAKSFDLRIQEAKVKREDVQKHFSALCGDVFAVCYTNNKYAAIV